MKVYWAVIFLPIWSPDLPYWVRLLLLNDLLQFKIVLVPQGYVNSCSDIRDRLPLVKEVGLITNAPIISVNFYRKNGAVIILLMNKVKLAYHDCLEIVPFVEILSDHINSLSFFQCLVCNTEVQIEFKPEKTRIIRVWCDGINSLPRTIKAQCAIFVIFPNSNRVSKVSFKRSTGVVQDILDPFFIVRLIARVNWFL